MRVLFLYPYLPAPGIGHGSARLMSHLLEGLRDHAEITLVCGWRPHEEKHLEAVGALCHRLYPVPRPFAEDLDSWARLLEKGKTAVRELKSGHPRPVVKLARRGFRRALRKALADGPYDIFHAELAVMAQYRDVARELPSMLVEHECGGVTSPNPRRWARYVQRYYGRFDRVVTLTPEDRNHLQALLPHRHISVRAPGVERPADPKRNPEPGRLLFFGSPGHLPNRDALELILNHVWPEVHRLRRDAKLGIAGFPKDDPLAIRAEESGAEALGFVDDLAAELARAALVIAPLQEGGGIRIKNLDTLAHGAPLLTTTLGNRGIGIHSGHDGMVVDGTKPFRRAILELLASPEVREEMGARGRELVARRFSFQRQTDRTVELWGEVLSDRGLRRPAHGSRSDRSTPPPEGP